jgi:hypothetical protein
LELGREWYEIALEEYITLIFSDLIEETAIKGDICSH